jgi:small ligand-binding sensory domain FIST
MPDSLFASVLTTENDSSKALSGAVRDLSTALAGRRPDLVAAFVSHHHGGAIESLGPRLFESTGARVVIGCTGEGILGTSQEIERGAALALWAGVMPSTDLRPFTIQAVQRGEKFEFTSMPDVRNASRSSVLLLADPFTFPASDFLERINEVLPGVPVVGGMASGGSGPGQNLLLTRDGIVESGAVGVVVEGEVEVLSVVSQGCRPVGKPFVITACKDNFILKLGGKTALQALMEMVPALSPADQALLQHRPCFIGLAIDASKSRFDRGDFLVRGMIGVEQKTGAVAVNDHGIRTGQTVQFLVRDAASAGEDLVQLMRERAGSRPRDRAHPSSMGALVFSCNGRGTRMFPKPHHDIGCVQTAFETEVPAAGFFAMGEIGPVGGRNFLHGFTASVAVFRPRDEA